MGGDNEGIGFPEHMDKTKGRAWKQGREMGLAGVGGEWLGENADNCT